MSAVTRMTSASRMTNVPEIGKMKLMIIANEIYKSRQAISESLYTSKLQLRDIVSSTEI